VHSHSGPSWGRAGTSIARAAILLLFLACAREEKRPAPVEPPPRQGGELRVLSEVAQDLDPVRSDEVYEAVVVRQIYEGLLTLDAGLQLRPALATSWTISPDGRTYSFSLRPGVRFHDGSILDAASVASSLERCIAAHREEPSFASMCLCSIKGAEGRAAGRSSPVEGLRALNERTLEIELSEPLSLFLKVLAMEQTAVTGPGGIGRGGKASLEEQPIGTGPFRFVRRRDDGGIVLGRFDDYWGERANLDSLVFLPSRSVAAGDEAEASPPIEIGALVRGDADYVELPSGTSALARSLGFVVHRTPELSVSFMGLRCDRPPLDDPAVRRAALLAIHREKLVAVDPEGMVPVNGFLPPGMPGRTPGNTMPDPDTEAARALLRDAGYPDGRGLPPLKVAVSEGSSPRLYEPILADLEAGGFTVKTLALSWRQLDSLASAGAVHAFMMSWVADLPDPDAFLYPLFHSTGQSNLFAYRSERVDSLLEEGRRLPLGPARNQVYARLSEILAADAPMIPLYHNSLAHAWRSAVRGIDVGPGGVSLICFREVHLDDGGSDAAHAGTR